MLIEMMHMNGSDHLDKVSKPSEGDASEKYASFDIENGSATERSFLNIGADGSTSTSCQKVPSQNSESFSAANVLKTLFFILVWYTFSTFLTLYNKTLLGDDMGKFPAPLLMNTVHFTMQAALSQAIVWYRCKRHERSVTMSWKDYFSRVVPTALATAMDVNLSNASLVFISVTFATMCKSAAPIFLLLFAFAFRLESPSIKLFGIISIISIGILLTVAKETAFEFWGFVFVMLAAFMSGFRWCMTQILLQVCYTMFLSSLSAELFISFWTLFESSLLYWFSCFLLPGFFLPNFVGLHLGLSLMALENHDILKKEDYGLKDPITFMSYVTPAMAVATAILSLAFDPWQEFRKNNYFNNSWHVMRSCLLMLLGGTLAFFMVLTEYILVSVTSAVTVTIAGVVKEAVTILVAVFYFHDEFTWLKGVGLLTIMIGVSLFNWYKYEKLHKGQSCEDEVEGSPASNTAAKYVILEEMQEQEDGT